MTVAPRLPTVMFVGGATVITNSRSSPVSAPQLIEGQPGAPASFQGPMGLLGLWRAAEDLNQIGEADSRFADAAAPEQPSILGRILRADFQARPEAFRAG
jgi:hypothetical protein